MLPDHQRGCDEARHRRGIGLSDQPWQEIRSLGNLLRHAYDDVLFGRLWTTIQDELPALRHACEIQLD
jgi:uncharacterized protein with HEPN domain